MTGRAMRSKRLDELVDTFKERAGKIARPENGPQYQMPLFRELERAMPNHLARSSLFAPIARGRRKQHDGIRPALRAQWSKRSATNFLRGSNLARAVPKWPARAAL